MGDMTKQHVPHPDESMAEHAKTRAACEKARSAGMQQLAHDPAGMMPSQPK